MMETHTYDRLLNYITDIDSKFDGNAHLIVCGDFNSHSSYLPDFVTHENFSHTNFLSDDYISDVPLLRCSQDHGILNNNGLLLLDLCKQTGLRIMNGRLEDLNGKCTYAGRTGSSVVDYVIATQKLFPFVKHFEVHEPNLLSDHCVVDFAFCFTKDV